MTDIKINLTKDGETVTLTEQHIASLREALEYYLRDMRAAHLGSQKIYDNESIYNFLWPEKKS